MIRAVARHIVRSLARGYPRPSVPPSVRREIVVIQPDHLGDGILALPALRALRRAAPFLRLTLMIGPWNLPLFCALGLADEVLTLPFPGFTRLRPRSPLEPYRMLWREAARLRRRAPLAAVILRDDHWWGAWLSALAGIPIRVGADHPDLRPFLTHPVQLGSTHVAARDVELVLALLRTLGADWIETEVTPQRFPLSWPVDPAAQKQVQALLDQQSLRSGFVVLHPGAGASAKCWPPDRWATVVDALTERGLAVVLTGKTGERPTLEEIARRAHSRVTILAGTLSLAMLAELLRLAQLVIGPDTGPLHLAVAVGTPSLHLFGPTRPERFGPWGPPERHRVLRAAMTCSRCGDIGPDRALGVGCMIALTPELVIREAERLLARGDQR